MPHPESLRSAFEKEFSPEKAREAGERALTRLSERAKKAFEMTVGYLVLAPEMAEFTAQFAASKGKEGIANVKQRVREALNAIKSGSEKAKDWGKNKVDQAKNLLGAINGAVRERIRSARDAAVNKVKNDRERLINQWKVWQEKRETRRLEKESQDIEKELNEIREMLRQLLERLDSLERRKQQIDEARQQLEVARSQAVA